MCFHFSELLLKANKTFQVAHLSLHSSFSVFQSLLKGGVMFVNLLRSDITDIAKECVCVCVFNNQTISHCDCENSRAETQRCMDE